MKRGGYGQLDPNDSDSDDDIMMVDLSGLVPDTGDAGAGSDKAIGADEPTKGGDQLDELDEIGTGLGSRLLTVYIKYAVRYPASSASAYLAFFIALGLGKCNSWVVGCRFGFFCDYRCLQLFAGKCLLYL